MTDVEIYWPATLPKDPLFAGEEMLRETGADVICRLQPVRRGAELSVLVLVGTTALQPILQAVLGRVGDELFAGLKHLVATFLHRGDPAAPAPAAVVFENAATGAQFVFLPDLPDTAFRRAIQLDAGDGDPGRWVWDTAHEQWQKFEPAQDERSPLT